VPYETRELGLATEEDVVKWIRKRQLGRRNSDSAEASYHRGKLLEAVGSQQGTAMDNGRPSKTAAAKEIADETGVPVSKVHKDQRKAKQIDSLIRALKTKVIGGEVKLTDEELKGLSELSADKQLKAFRDVRVGTHKSWKAAVGKYSTPAKKPKAKKAKKAKVKFSVDAVEDAFARLIKLVDAMDDAYPDHSRKPGVQKHLRAAHDLFDDWRKEEDV
jgi:hypothetical protein